MRMSQLYGWRQWLKRQQKGTDGTNTRGEAPS